MKSQQIRWAAPAFRHARPRPTGGAVTLPQGFRFWLVSRLLCVAVVLFGLRREHMDMQQRTGIKCGITHGAGLNARHELFLTQGIT